MKASELRIGNLVLLDTGFCPPFPHKIMAEDLAKWDKIPTGAKVEPIEITQEWLKKFGLGQSNDHEMQKDIREDLAIQFDYHFKRCYLFVDTDLDCTCIFLEHIKYVHQLQNLYFALTGEEL